MDAPIPSQFYLISFFALLFRIASEILPQALANPAKQKGKCLAAEQGFSTDELLSTR